MCFEADDVCLVSLEEEEDISSVFVVYDNQMHDSGYFGLRHNES